MSNNSHPFAFCTVVTPQCPVSATLYRYRPSLAANTFFIAIFALCAVLQLVVGIRWRTWSYMVALVLGCVGEVIGYSGRIMLHENPWNTAGFEIQLICLVVSPAFIAAGVYLSMKHFVLLFGQDHSRLKPKMYTWIFIGVDILSILIQASGGALSATSRSESLINTGTDIAVAGIVFQVFSLLVFGLLTAEYTMKVYNGRSHLSDKALGIAQLQHFQLHVLGLVIAYFAILTRCVYRIPELALGLQNSIQLNQTLFIVLDGAMVTIATVAMTVIHPGFCFQKIVEKYVNSQSLE